jgi:hypothetical protein
VYEGTGADRVSTELHQGRSTLEVDMDCDAVLTLFSRIGGRALALSSLRNLISPCALVVGMCVL